MKLFVDTANLEEIEKALQGGFIRGVTTNPSLLAKEPKANYVEHMKKVVDLANKYGGTASVSIEVFSDDPKTMVAQAEEFVAAMNYKNLAIKVQVSHGAENKLAVVEELSKKGIQVNCTACMTPMQAMMAAASGAKYVSLFYNRLRDGGKDEKFSTEREAALKGGALEQTDFDPNQVIRETRALLVDYPQAEIISGSIRSVLDVKQAGLAGSHIVTASLKIMEKALTHYKTDEAVDQFFADFAAWTS